MQIPRQTTARVLVSAFAFALGIPQSAQAAPTSPKAERTAHQGHPPAKHVRRAKVRKKVRKNRSRVRKTERTKARPQRQRPQKKASSRRTPHTKPPALRVERATSVAPLSAREHAIVQAARRYLGASYRLGGRGDDGTFDCSGFVLRVYADSGLAIARTASAQARHGEPVALRDVRPGDVVYFGTPIHHTGIVVRNHGGTLVMIHASSSLGVVETTVTTSSYWSARMRGARRFL